MNDVVRGMPTELPAGDCSSAPALQTSRKPLLVCLSHLRWHFVTQRPQHLLVRAAAQYSVLFFEEPVFDSDHAHLARSACDGITVLVPHLPVNLPDHERDATLATLLAEAAGSDTAVLWYYTAAAIAFSRDLARQMTVYDNMDELSAFRGASPDLLRLEQELLERADLVFTGGRSLFEAKRDRHPAVHCFPSSVEVAHFNQARASDLPDPADQSALPHPRLGFFGVIDERMDLDLVGGVASRRPDWQLVMIGPVVKIDPADLPRLPNVHWLGMKRYDELPGYLAHWDLALMPFASNESTRFISPTKTPEFLAGGLPVVSTPIADVVHDYGRSGLVAIAADAAEAVAAAERLLVAPRPLWLKQVDAKLQTTSWDATWAAMHALLERHAVDGHGFAVAAR